MTRQINKSGGERGEALLPWNANSRSPSTLCTAGHAAGTDPPAGLQRTIPTISVLNTWWYWDVQHKAKTTSVEHWIQFPLNSRDLENWKTLICQKKKKCSPLLQMVAVSRTPCCIKFYWSHAVGTYTNFDPTIISVLNFQKAICLFFQ